jgi:hypothetical protein
MTKQKLLSALRKELMNQYEYMRCGNLEEFKQRLQWLSEGMLKNHITHIGSIPDQFEIQLYIAYRAKRTEIQNGVNP